MSTQVSRARREDVYREYMTFFERAERQRRWRLEDDVPWDKLDQGANTEGMAVCLETFCGVELYVPDYTAAGFLLNRQFFGHAWFQACWGYEESKHALVYREYLTRSGLRTLKQYLDYEEKIFAKTWQLPYQTRRQMICYGAIQEAATYLIYQAQRQKYQTLGNECLERIFFLVARDEAAHAGFYRSLLKLEMEADQAGALEDIARVVCSFNMPGVGLIPDYDARLATEGVGISSEKFLKDAVFPMLRKMGTSRAELVRAMRRQRAGEGNPVEVESDFMQEALKLERERRSSDRAEPAAHHTVGSEIALP